MSNMSKMEPQRASETARDPKQGNQYTHTRARTTPIKAWDGVYTLKRSLRFASKTSKHYFVKQFKIESRIAEIDNLNISKSAKLKKRKLQRFTLARNADG